MNAYSRTELLLGRDAMEKLRRSRVAIFGLGGVGGYVAEALARCGVGAIDVVDHDTVSLTNLNRQILATRQTVGQSKARAAADRIHAINPEITVTVHETFYLPETADSFDFTQYNYIVDAIDTVTGKLMLVEAAQRAGTPRRQARPSSAPWAPATSWTPPASRWRTFPRPACVLWPGSCARSAKSGASKS